jgi:hypothetical protein
MTGQVESAAIGRSGMDNQPGIARPSEGNAARSMA